MIRVFIGYDPAESAAFYTLCHSILEHASQPVSITPVALSSLKGILTRERDPLQSNDFAFSRFLVPWMCNYEGHAIFMDCDMLVTDDIAKLWALRDDLYAVKVVKHNHVPTETKKYLDQPQTPYARKNWSSVMLFDCSKCKVLDPAYVNTATGLSLHQFLWLETEKIGDLPKTWNHLVGYDPKPKDLPYNLHYTTGGPYFNDYKTVEYSAEWWVAFDKMKNTKQVTP